MGLENAWIVAVISAGSVLLGSVINASLTVWKARVDRESGLHLKRLELQFEAEKLRALNEVAEADLGKRKLRHASRLFAKARADLLRLQATLVRAENPLDFANALTELDSYFREHPAALALRSNWNFFCEHLQPEQIRSITSMHDWGLVPAVWERVVRIKAELGNLAPPAFDDFAMQVGSPPPAPLKVPLTDGASPGKSG